MKMCMEKQFDVVDAINLQYKTLHVWKISTTIFNRSYFTSDFFSLLVNWKNPLWDKHFFKLIEYSENSKLIWQFQTSNFKIYNLVIWLNLGVINAPMCFIKIKIIYVLVKRQNEYWWIWMNDFGFHSSGYFCHFVYVVVMVQ